MIAIALRIEVEQYMQSLRHLRDDHGHALVVRNGAVLHPKNCTRLQRLLVYDLLAQMLWMPITHPRPRLGTPARFR